MLRLSKISHREAGRQGDLLSAMNTVTMYIVIIY